LRPTRRVPWLVCRPSFGDRLPAIRLIVFVSVGNVFAGGTVVCNSSVSTTITSVGSLQVSVLRGVFTGTLSTGGFSLTVNNTVATSGRMVLTGPSSSLTLFGPSTVESLITADALGGSLFMRGAVVAGTVRVLQQLSVQLGSSSLFTGTLEASAAVALTAINPASFGGTILLGAQLTVTGSLSAVVNATADSRLLMQSGQFSGTLVTGASLVTVGGTTVNGGVLIVNQPQGGLLFDVGTVQSPVRVQVASNRSVTIGAATVSSAINFTAAAGVVAQTGAGVFSGSINFPAFGVLNVSAASGRTFGGSILPPVGGALRCTGPGVVASSIAVDSDLSMYLDLGFFSGAVVAVNSSLQLVAGSGRTMGGRNDLLSHVPVSLSMKLS
jgi:hypothetical protein